MQGDFNTYAAEMKLYLENQNRRITALEAEISILKDTLTKLNDRAPVNIEKIEYKFDQLKIERLDGTLNIGLNPADIRDLEEFSVEDKPYPVPFPSNLRSSFNESISANIYTFIDKELSSLITNVETEMNANFQGQYDEFIKEDLYKQLPNRIQYYFNQFPYNETMERQDEYNEKITEQIKTDIEQAVRAFLMNARNGMKGR